MSRSIDSIVIQNMESRVKLYSEQASGEPWKVDHENAMACLDLEETLRFGVSIYDALLRLDEAVRGEIMARADAHPSDEKRLRAIKGIFEWWLRPCDKVEARIESCTKRGYPVSGADDFRKRKLEARWIVGDASSVLNSSKMVDLRDDAIDEARRQDCA